MSPCAVAAHVLEVILSCGLELVPNEAQSQHPASECVGFVFGLLRLGACVLDLLCKLVDCEAKLDECLGLSGMKAVAFAIAGSFVLEASEFDRAVTVEEAVEVSEMVSGFMIMPCHAPCSSLAGVPDVLQLGHGLGLLLVDLLQEGGVNRAAVASQSVASDADCLDQLAFVACHDVHQIADALRGVSLAANMNMHSTSAGAVTAHSRLAEGSDNTLQKFHVLVVKDRADHLALLSLGTVDGNILLHLPLTTLGIPSTPAFVAVASCGVLVASGSEELGGNLGCLLTGDVVSLDFNANYPDYREIPIFTHLCRKIRDFI